jgi:Glycosyltransferase family 10 (fucosyltransferase) C-term
MNSVVIVCDVPDHYLENRIFTDKVQKDSFGEGFWIILKAKAEVEGWEMITADIYMSNREKYKTDKACMISYMTTSRTSQLLNAGVIPLAVYSLESPNVAINFYTNIKSIASKYKYSILFKGVAESLSSPNCIVLNWPNTLKEVVPFTNWEQRKFLCMIASNKSKYAVEPGKPFDFLLQLRKRIGLVVMDIKAPFVKVIDLYSHRFKAIEFFSNVPGFSLFGTRWDKTSNLSRALAERIKVLNPQPVAFRDKMDTLNKFKYCICFENCIHPGYLTEKIFDCFFAGVIPIYYGAPDVEKFVPKQCFIDFREFESFAELNTFLKGMTLETEQKYLDAASSFVNGNDFEKFTDKYMANQIFDMIIKK